MQLLLARHLWGLTGEPEDLFPRIKSQGYQAIENGLPEPDQVTHFQDLLQKNALTYIPQIFTNGNTIEEHLADFRRQLEQAQVFQPEKVNCHSGRDVWSLDQSLRFYREAVKIEADLGMAVAHETHRGRVFFYPGITAQVLERVETLKLCCDLSHWVCVGERLLDDQLDIVRQCAERCIHIHGRVGYEEGPQVPDPRAPEYLPYVEAHEVWWNIIWNAQEKQGMKVSTFTPEFGPPGYLHTLPYTQVPVADLEEICNWQAQRELEVFARRPPASHG
ncbi:hypothetical protein KDA_59200 [Dictyobacter alpinus]|uniref:Xylose isomerase-like TIM barrel domain-containing protein n=1 Tax=Dictyobacter alpinus TaxID=2014873 RepID=A0A402BGH4_9CHLR|nr:TIM barrel protein [Dictyobacter alpinus]GCE30436.1 hypothetical protein KDA_59200 [Dictyobacter alpinus]